MNIIFPGAAPGFYVLQDWSNTLFSPSDDLRDTGGLRARKIYRIPEAEEERNTLPDCWKTTDLFTIFPRAYSIGGVGGGDWVG